MVNQKSKIIFTALLCLFLIIGCSNKPALVLQPEKPLPDWYLNPPANSFDTLTGIGGGATLEQATDSALSNLVSRLGVSIESKFESVTESTKYTYSNNSVEYIKSEVSKIRISNYELVFSEQIKYNQFVVMVKSKRTQFIKDLKQQVNNLLANEKQAIKNASADNALKRYHVIKIAAEESKKLAPTLIVLSSMDEDFDNDYYQKEIQSLQTQVEQARRHILFIIKTDAKSNKAAAPIKNALSQQGFSVGDSVRREGVLIINLQTNAQRNASMGFQIAEMLVKVSVTDYKGRLVGANNVNLTGHATRGFELAEIAAIEKFAEVIKEQGIAKVLGIAL